MWLTAEKDNLIQLYGWNVPYAWLPNMFNVLFYMNLTPFSPPANAFGVKVGMLYKMDPDLDPQFQKK